MDRECRQAKWTPDAIAWRACVWPLLGVLLLSGCGVRATGDPKASPKAGEHPSATAAAQAAQSVDSPPFAKRIKAPSLDGGVGWINTSAPLRLDDLRGKFVVLDFWTYCCVNCMQELPELKQLEHKYPKEIVVIGVHSAKFDGEKQTENIAQAVRRYGIEHPVVNDAEHEIWDRFGVNAWPTLMVIDPEGYLVAADDGEVSFARLDAFFGGVIPYYRRHKLLDETPLNFHVGRAAEPNGPLRFPGKVLADEASQRLFIADSGHNRVVVATLGGKLLDVVGSGQAGEADGPFASATFNHPQGLALNGQFLYVADTENHLIRKIDLVRKQVITVAGTGKLGHAFWPGFDPRTLDPKTKLPKIADHGSCPPKTASLSSPWALATHDGWLYIAMAGAHQIWRMSLDDRAIEIYAGNGRENIQDGPRLPEVPPIIDRLAFGEGYASFAQPSGLAVDGQSLYVADSEGSAVRSVPLKGDDPVVTVVGPANLPEGRALFTFGDTNGKADEVRLQHVMGIAAHGGLLYIADTYNNKIKVVDPRARTARTQVGDAKAGRQDQPPEFFQPAGLSYAAGRLYVADTNNHLIRTVELAEPHKVGTLFIDGLTPPAAKPKAVVDEFRDAPRVAVAAATVKPTDGTVKLVLKLALLPHWKINALGGMHYRLDAVGDAGPLDPKALGESVAVPPDQRRDELHVTLPLRADRGQARLSVSLAFYYCREGREGICKVGSVVWTLPLSVAPDGSTTPVVLTYQPPGQ